MKRFRKGIPAILSLSLLFILGGCTGAGDILHHGYNGFLQSISRYALTGETALQGIRLAGADIYTGTYQANYANFCGKEILFGATSLERKLGNRITVHWDCKLTAGSGTLSWKGGSQKQILADSACTGAREITLSSGDNYLIFEGDGLTGSLFVTVE